MIAIQRFGIGNKSMIQIANDGEPYNCDEQMLLEAINGLRRMMHGQLIRARDGEPTGYKPGMIADLHRDLCALDELVNRISAGVPNTWEPTS